VSGEVEEHLLEHRPPFSRLPLFGPPPLRYLLEAAADCLADCLCTPHQLIKLCGARSGTDKNRAKGLSLQGEGGLGIGAHDIATSVHSMSWYGFGRRKQSQDFKVRGFSFFSTENSMRCIFLCAPLPPGNRSPPSARDTLNRAMLLRGSADGRK